LCRHDLAESAKSDNIWLSGQHVANILATFPAKAIIQISCSLARPELVKTGGPIQFYGSGKVGNRNY
jgi:hypothetical protein